MTMKIAGFDAWRLLFVVAGLFIIAGGAQHPREPTMAEMLANPIWVQAHLLVLAGFVVMLAALIMLRSVPTLPKRTRTWVGIAVIGTALQAVEMAVHTAAVVDHGHLVAGQSTPVLTTHLSMSVILYPIFAVTIIGLILAGTRDRALGSPWIAWLGIIGAAAHGAAPPLVVGLEIEEAAILFPMVMLLAFWFILAAVWPSRVTVRA